MKQQQQSASRTAIAIAESLKTTTRAFYANEIKSEELRERNRKDWKRADATGCAEEVRAIISQRWEL